MNPTPESLRAAKCLPCEGGVDKFDGDQAQQRLSATPLWSIDSDAKMISRKIDRKNFLQVVELVNLIARLAEDEQHHPDLHVTGYRHLTIDLTTHAIGGLSENDFILAAKIDQLIEDSTE